MAGSTRGFATTEGHLAGGRQPRPRRRGEQYGRGTRSPAPCAAGGAPPRGAAGARGAAESRLSCTHLAATATRPRIDVRDLPLCCHLPCYARGPADRHSRAPHRPERSGPSKQLRPTRAGHWLGTDELGRDNLTRVLYAGQVSLLIGFVVAVVSLLLGVPLGLIARLLRRAAWTTQSTPSSRYCRTSRTLFLLIILSVTFRPGPH